MYQSLSLALAIALTIFGAKIVDLKKQINEAPSYEKFADYARDVDPGWCLLLIEYPDKEELAKINRLNLNLSLCYFQETLNPHDRTVVSSGPP